MICERIPVVAVNECSSKALVTEGVDKIDEEDAESSAERAT